MHTRRHEAELRLNATETNLERVKDVLKDAQNKGFAELDPTFDIQGIDAAHKLSLLSTICFGSEIIFDKISCIGISNIDIG